MKTVLSMADQACLQYVLGTLLTSRSLRDRLAVRGVRALREDEHLSGEITPGAWHALQEIAPHSHQDLAAALEHDRAPHPTLRQVRFRRSRSDAA